MATSPLPSWGPHGAQKSLWLHQPCLLGVPIVRRNQYGYITLAFSGSEWWGEPNMATSLLPSGGPHDGEKSIWLHHCAFSGSPWWGEFNMGDGKWLKMVENGQKWVTFEMCHIPNAAEEAKKKTLYGTKNLSKGAKSRVRVFTNI